MDIAKIRKKAQAEAQNQSREQSLIQAQGQTQDPDKDEKTAEPGRNQVDEPAEGLLTHSSGQPADDRTGHPEEKLEEKPKTGAGETAGTAEITASDSGQATQDLPEAPAPERVDGLPAIARDDGGIAELLIFSLAKEEFAFKVSEVEEIIRFQRITSVPTMPAYVAGITSLRGKIIPVIDLRTRLALKEDGREVVSMPKANADGLIGGTGKIIVLSGPLGLIGVIIDKVLGVVRLPDDVILEPPAHLTEDETKFIEGVVIVDKRFISIIRSADALKIEVG